MNIGLIEVFTIMKKELTHFFRDPHVLIYSLILPTVGYPLLIVGGFEAALWQQSLSEKKKVIVAIVGPAQKLALSEAIRQSAQFQVKSIPAPANLEPSVALSRGDLDVIVRLAKTPGTTEMAKTPETIEIVTNGGSDRAVLATKRIMAIANDVRDRNLVETLKADSKPANFLKIFTIKMRNLAAIAEMSTYILPAICAFALFMIGFGALYPAVCAFPEEREKHTLDSTLMLPVGRSSVVIGKTLAITLAGFLSGLINLVSMLMVFWVFTIQPNVQKLFGSLGGGTFFGNFSWAQIILIAACFAVTAFETAAIYLFMAQAARTFKEGQNILTLPLLLMAVLPVAVCAPGLSLNWTTVMLPLVNTALSLRASFASACDWNLCLLALTQNLVISALLVLLVAKIVGREEFLRGDASLFAILTGRQWRKQ